jgi:hypothetical protein
MSLDPETTLILVEAFDAAWQDLAAVGCAAAIGPEADAFRDRLARRIVAQAQRGVHDPIELSSDGVAYVLATAANSRTFRRQHGGR